MTKALPPLDATAPVPVTVVMPVLNEESYLADAVAAVLDNGYDGPVELVIALGPSTDGTDAIAIRPMAYLPMSWDHRALDGAEAARFLSRIKERLEKGEVR